MEIQTIIPWDMNGNTFCAGIDGSGQAQAIATDENGHILVSTSGGSALYEYASFVLAPATVDYNVDTQQAGLFDTITTAGNIEITTTATISIRFNANTNASIVMTSGESPKKFNIASTNMFLDCVAGGTVSTLLQP